MIRFGIIGMGNIGRVHAKYLVGGEVCGGTLTAMCDVDAEKLEKYHAEYGDGYEYYTDYKEMLSSGKIDAVIVATPHYQHPEISEDSIKAGMHVIVEKPVGVYMKGQEDIAKTADDAEKVYSVMFCVRTDPFFKKIRSLLLDGELGEIKRVNWIATDWYRPEAYHKSSSWRSSWEGEGGGVLVNQSPHNLDILTWLFGLPEKVTAFAKNGKYYDIEVEDEVTAYLDYGKFSCVYIASTGEVPGSNRLEIVGDKGQLIYEKGKLHFSRCRESEREFNKKNTIPFGKPEVWEIDILPDAGQMKHSNITQNFVNAITNGDELIASGKSGEDELRLSNAIHLSAWLGETVEVPCDEDRFLEELNKKRAGK